MDKYNNKNDLCSMNATNFQSFELEFIQNLSEGTQTNENFQVSVDPSISLNYGDDDDDIGRNKREKIYEKLPECSTSSVVECSGVLPDCQIDIDNFHNNQLKIRMLNTEKNLTENNPEFPIGILINSERLSCETITEHLIPREIHDSPQQINEISQNINEIINYNALNKEKRIIDLENQNNELLEKMITMKNENDQLKSERIAIKSFVNDRLRLENSCSNINNEILLLDIPTKHFESFEYLYEDISQMRTVWAKSSVTFNSCDDKYGMILELWPRGCSHDHRDSHMCLDFKLLENSRLCLNSHFDLPLNCRVTLYIGLQSSTNQNRITVEKYLNFYKYSPEKSLPQFHLSIQDLKKTSAIESDCLFIRCCVYID